MGSAKLQRLARLSYGEYEYVTFFFSGGTYLV